MTDDTEAELYLDHEVYERVRIALAKADDPDEVAMWLREIADEVEMGKVTPVGEGE